MVRVIRTQFIDISKVIGLVDATKAEEFKKRNKAAMAEHLKSHDHDTNDEDHSHSCGDVTKKYYIPEEHMSFVDKTINSKVSSNAFFKQRLAMILQRAHDATTTIQGKAKARGMVLEAD